MLRCASIGLGWWGGEHAIAAQGNSQLLSITACHTDSGDGAVDSAAMQSLSKGSAHACMPAPTLPNMHHGYVA